MLHLVVIANSVPAKKRITLSTALGKIRKRSRTELLKNSASDIMTAPSITSEPRHIGIAILSGLTIPCNLVILPILKRKNDTAYYLIAVAEVLVLAASGICNGGVH